MKTIDVSQLCYTDVDFNVIDVFPENWLQRKEFSLYKEKKRPCNALFFVCSDIEISFFLSDGTPVITAKNGDVVYIPKGVCYYVHVSGETGKKTDTYTINLNFYNRQTNEFLLNDSITRLCCLKDNRQEIYLKSLCSAFHREKRNLVKAKGELYTLLDVISFGMTEDKEFYYPIKKGVEVFLEEWNKNEKIEKYASLCGVSVTYFYRCFKKWSKSSPVEYRNNLRLSNAESLLRCTDIKIQEISGMIGFDDPFYFCRLFTVAYGVSPKKYRLMHQSD